MTTRRKTILVFALDREGYQLNCPWPEGEESMKAAKAEARRMLADEDLIQAGLGKVEIRVNGECVWDHFVLRRKP